MKRTQGLVPESCWRTPAETAELPEADAWGGADGLAYGSVLIGRKFPDSAGNDKLHSVGVNPLLREGSRIDRACVSPTGTLPLWLMEIGNDGL